MCSSDLFNSSFLPEEIMTMDWLAENVIGSIPKKEELKEQAEPVIKEQGVAPVKNTAINGE